MKKFIFAATLVFFGGVASVHAQSSADQEDLTLAALQAAVNDQMIESTHTVSKIESEQLRLQLEKEVSSALEKKIQAKLDSQMVLFTQ